MSDARAAFQAWITAPPYERDITRYPDDAEKFAWPGQYRDITVDLAWMAWQEAQDEMRSELAAERETTARLRGTIVALDTERRVLKAELEAVKREALDEAESAARQSCHTGQAKRDYMGQVAGTLVTDSGAISTNAELLRRLAEAGRFRIVAEHGRMVVGYWPENDPQNKQEAKP